MVCCNLDEQQSSLHGRLVLFLCRPLICYMLQAFSIKKNHKNVTISRKSSLSHILSPDNSLLSLLLSLSTTESDISYNSGECRFFSPSSFVLKLYKSTLSPYIQSSLSISTFSNKMKKDLTFNTSFSFPSIPLRLSF